MRLKPKDLIFGIEAKKLRDVFRKSPWGDMSIEFFKEELDTDKFINNIENGITKEKIEVWKYHASQWRPIEKKKTKWAYKEKAVKSETCNIQRLLN